MAFSRAVISALAVFIASAAVGRRADAPRLIRALSGVAFCVPSPTTVMVSRGPATAPAPTEVCVDPPAPARTATAVTADAAIAINAPITIRIPERGPTETVTPALIGGSRPGYPGDDAGASSG